MTCTHSPYWISHPAPAYTPIVLIYFSVKTISLSRSFSVCLSMSLSIFGIIFILWLFGAGVIVMDFKSCIVLVFMFDGWKGWNLCYCYEEKNQLWNIIDWKKGFCINSCTDRSGTITLVQDGCQNTQFPLYYLLMYCRSYSVLSTAGGWKHIHIHNVRHLFTLPSQN